MTRTMFDAVDAKDVPAHGWDLLAGYSNGNYQSYLPLKARFPKATVVSIDTQNKPGEAQVCDIEKGDARPDEAPAWFDRSVALGVIRPTLYYSASDHLLIRGYMGNRKYDGWVASYGVKQPVDSNGHPIVSDSQFTLVAWQYIDHGPNGENIDISDVFDPYWPYEGVFMALSDAQQQQLFDNVNHVFNFLHNLDLTAQGLGYQNYDDLIAQTTPKKR